MSILETLAQKLEDINRLKMQTCESIDTKQIEVNELQQYLVLINRQGEDIKHQLIVKEARIIQAIYDQIKEIKGEMLNGNY